LVTTVLFQSVNFECGVVEFLIPGTGSVKNIFEGELGVVDFHPFNKRCILYVFETDNVVGNNYKRNLVRFRNISLLLANSSLQDIVVVENTRLSEQYFPAMQKFVVCKLGLKLLPAASQLEASQLLTRIVHGASKDNLFRRRSVSRLLDPLVMSLVQQIPGVGKVKAMALLQHYSIIHQLCNAGTHELEPIVGHALAQHIRNFFHNPLV
ncbi:Fanconi anemia core complex-associated protein 24-like, partial [Coregonus clupeaformis]|uniref:Fanconi anemia core complex-associated protein 24-like n=1 Tax=Coregonus clupeaformis TaxID=59861 RepID=UPI001BE0D9F6